MCVENSVTYLVRENKFIVIPSRRCDYVLSKERKCYTFNGFGALKETTIKIQISIARKSVCVLLGMKFSLDI